MTKVLFLGCHADDIDLACGGTIHKRLGQWDIHCATLSSSSFSPQGENGPHSDIWMCQMEAFETLGLKQSQFDWFHHRTNFFYEERNEVWKTLKLLRDKLAPDMVFTHAADDHQDHVVLAVETMRVFQYSSVLEYHIPRSQRTFVGNYFTGLNEADVEAKVRCLKCYPMYEDKHYFQESLLRAQLVCNGGYIGQQYAEAFRVIQLIET